MFPAALGDRVEMLINDLIDEGGLTSSSLASILLAAQDSVSHGYSLELSRRVWQASNELNPGGRVGPETSPPPPPADRRRKNHRVV
jgi:hypothetical protein